MSPVKYESHASASPSKLTVSNRKQRNQTANRVHDIEFAAEISTSLISQVRGLQALLAEREEDLRVTKQDLAQLEDTSESLRERVKELDESEHRYKEENWNLETRIRDLEAAQRDAADNDKKVAQQLAVLSAEKLKTQRELDELKASHSRLVDDHTAAVKLHDTELGAAKRNMAMADSENATLQRKIDELAGQNQELARAVALQHRARAVENDALPATSEDEFDTDADNITPEHSPPASPVKGTPRHSVLESETLKTSLLHSQRTMQTLRTNLHREKTEKLELRRMLQDARDELERARSDPNGLGSGPSKKSRKDARDVHNKLRSSQLGGARSSRTDLFMVASADPDWEELHGEASPSTARPRAAPADSSDNFETADETHLSDTSFATANDGAETPEDFHTGAEQLSSGEDTMTETERDPARRRLTSSRGALSTAAVPVASDEFDADAANQSTASTSDDDGFDLPRTPTLSASNGVARMRLRVSRSSLASRRLRQMSSVEEVGSSPAGLRSSPFSAAGSPAVMGIASSSTNSTPRAMGQQQSLFAELGELGDDSDEDAASDGTASRFHSPGLAVPLNFGEAASNSGNSMPHSPLTQAAHSPKIVMVDRATLTEAVTILPLSDEEDQPLESRPSSFMSDDAVAMGEKLKQFPSPPTSPPQRGPLTPILLSPLQKVPYTRSVEVGPDPVDPVLSFIVSDVVSVNVEPVAEVVSPLPSPVILGMSSVSAEDVTPYIPPTPPAVELPVFSTSTMRAVDITPIELPPPVVPVTAVLPKEEPPTFSLSSIQQQAVVPIAEPIAEQVVERALPIAVEPLSMSVYHTQHVVPVLEPEVPVAPLPALSVSNIHGQELEPVATPDAPLPQMVLSNVFSQDILPVVVEEAAVGPHPALLSMSAATQTDEWKPEASSVSAGKIAAGAALLGAATAAAIGADSVPRSPKRNGFIMPKDFDPIVIPGEGSLSRDQPTTPNKIASNPLLGWSSLKGPPTPIIAEDDTRQSPNNSLLSDTPESQRPFKEISVNANAPRLAQYNVRQRLADDDQNFMPSSPTSPQSVIRDEDYDATPRATGKASKAEAGISSMTGTRRPGSSSSSLRQSNDPTVPPLPPNHREVIEAARSGSAGSLVGEEAPASIAVNLGSVSSNWRARTPTGPAREPMFAIHGAMPMARAINRNSGGDARPVSRRTNGSNAGVYAVAGIPGTISRQTSMSSFASEVDARFHINDGADVFETGHSNIDPRMIQAITQTMIGEYLWKYTRKAGRSGLSENRHRRYFWIHPYTRMLYWSDKGPTPGSRAEQRAKSVIIEGVRVVTDDNPMPPGLHRKSLIVISPGRTIKFTCTTGHRHEIWFNALSYLLLRNDEGADCGMAANGEHITREDVEEFNPSFGHRPSGAPQARRRPPVSLSSYNSRTTRNESPAFNASMNIPTLTPTPKRNTFGSASPGMTPSASVAGLTSRSRLSRIGGYWRSSQSLSAQFNSLRSRSSTRGHRHTDSGAQDSSIYEASEVNDSAEDLRALYEAQDRASDRLENVRACCDGRFPLYAQAIM